jgi:hypothetical protein
MADKKRILKKHPIYGSVFSDGSMSIKGKNGRVFHYPAYKMDEVKTAYMGANRIHKPMFLLFYTDVLNGKGSKYE